MTKLVGLLLLLVPFVGYAHPGVGIVKDSKGNIFFTDLHQVWKISNSKRTVVVPNVHTHELYIDENDNLFGEGGYYDDKAVKFYHYLWVLRPNGRIDTVVGMKEQYIHQDFSLAKDKKGYEFYIKRFLRPHTDTNHIYRRSPDGKEIVLTTGNFNDVNWLHPQEDGSLLYASKNIIFRVDSSGAIKLVTEKIRNQDGPTPRNGILIWGIWQDNAGNVYAAVYSDKTIKKIDPNGDVTTIYKSKGKWSPLHGVFDIKGKLWVLENSEKNDVQVVSAEEQQTNAIGDKSRNGFEAMPYLIAGFCLFGIGFILLNRKILKSNPTV